MHRLMLVDDEPNILRALKRVLAGGPYTVETFEDPEEALARTETVDYDLALSDYRMPRMDGVEFLTRLRLKQPNAMRLILSGFADLEALMDAINVAEIYRFISKPWSDYELRATLSQALAHHDALEENRRLADAIRQSQAELEVRERELKRLEALHPGITQVTWANDGSILIGPEDV
ncbi:MAG: hypothetical protein A2151_06525 [Candidatus Muproteobacteria bacterium RBG_16_65_34]|uniref:Response regulatory domain-containing protein n=1 Tax=Candidatus Muproteobacteria bacterium RBG_16_65_34 TaxID=1817760 RepID=A0A1F6TKH3_9PROT|nr:MAG: hypothetical protein A2151_06525 [Candidatus Muproteobacteria bacterium RBG_16_65_34]